MGLCQSSYASQILLDDKSAFREKKPQGGVNEELLDALVYSGRVNVVAQIGQEAFYTVYKGFTETTGQPVTVKYAKTPEEIAYLTNEVLKMAGLRHMKIVRFYGVCWYDTSSLSAIVEHMDLGDLRTFLDGEGAHETWRVTKLPIARDIAQALAFLHAQYPVVLHRDLKSRNIFLSSKRVAKLGNFGSSGCLDFEKTRTSMLMVLQWAAPEVLMEEDDYNHSADIYSFGVLLSELQTGRKPFSNYKMSCGSSLPMMIVSGKICPEFDAPCPDSIIKLSEACCQVDPRQRPSAEEILEIINNEVFLEISESLL